VYPSIYKYNPASVSYFQCSACDGVWNPSCEVLAEKFICHNVLWLGLPFLFIIKSVLKCKLLYINVVLWVDYIYVYLQYTLLVLNYCTIIHLLPDFVASCLIVSYYTTELPIELQYYFLYKEEQIHRFLAWFQSFCFIVPDVTLVQTSTVQGFLSLLSLKMFYKLFENQWFTNLPLSAVVQSSFIGDTSKYNTEICEVA
jgi:hypothetical protein